VVRTRIQAVSSIAAGTDADKGWFLAGVPEGKILTISQVAYWGGDTGQSYDLILIPAGMEVNNVTIDGEVGMMPLVGRGSGGASNKAEMETWQSQASYNPIPGPVSICICSDTAVSTAFFASLLGILSDWDD